MTERAKRNIKSFIVGCIIGGACLWAMLLLPGCNFAYGVAHGAAVGAQRDLESINAED
jgi:hypothetical protein